MMRATGGLALGETSTRSSSYSAAFASASSIDRIPICSPSGAMTRTSRAVMASLRRSFCPEAIAAPPWLNRLSGVHAHTYGDKWEIITKLCAWYSLNSVRTRQLEPLAPIVSCPVESADLRLRTVDELGQRHSAHILAGTGTQGHRASLAFALAHHQHVWNPHPGMFADLVADFFIAQIRLHAQSGGSQLALNLPGVIGLCIRDIEHHGLHRRQP